MLGLVGSGLYDCTLRCKTNGLAPTMKNTSFLERKENDNPNKLCIVDKQCVNEQFCQL